MLSRLRYVACAVVLSAAGLASAEVGVGQQFPSFSATNMLTGKQFKLEDFRGKVVLIDFWATWCGPCIAELPNVKKAYAEFKKDGFEIISISLDQSVDKCKSFVEKEQMNWVHVCDGKGWKAALAQKYGVTGIPQMYVLGRDGKVVESEARGPALEAAIKKALATKYVPEPDDELDKAARKELTAADKLVAEKRYAEAVKMYDDIGVKYAGRDIAKEANQKARDLREDPAIAEQIKATPAGDGKKPADLEEARTKGEQWLKTARQMAEAKKVSQARKFYQRVIDTYPGTPQAEAAKKEMDALPKE